MLTISQVHKKLTNFVDHADRKSKGAQEEFNTAVASKLNGTECYLEWQRVNKPL